MRWLDSILMTGRRRFPEVDKLPRPIGMDQGPLGRRNRANYSESARQCRWAVSSGSSRTRRRKNMNNIFYVIGVVVVVVAILGYFGLR